MICGRRPVVPAILEPFRNPPPPPCPLAALYPYSVDRHARLAHTVTVRPSPRPPGPPPPRTHVPVPSEDLVTTSRGRGTRNIVVHSIPRRAPASEHPAGTRLLSKTPTFRPNHLSSPSIRFPHIPLLSSRSLFDGFHSSVSFFSDRPPPTTPTVTADPRRDSDRTDSLRTICQFCLLLKYCNEKNLTHIVVKRVS